MRIKTTLLLLAAMIGLSAYAQPERLHQNEDLRFIREQARAQKAVTLAAAMALTSDQAAALRTIRTEVDGIKAQYEPLLEEVTTALELAAATIRTEIEGGAELSADHQTTLRNLHREHAQIRREMRGAIGEAAGDLRAIITLEQWQILRDHLRRDRFCDDCPEGEGFAAAGKGFRSPHRFRGEGHRRSQGRFGSFRGKHGEDRASHRRGEGFSSRHGRKGMHGLRILLSDAFLAQLP